MSSSSGYKSQDSTAITNRKSYPENNDRKIIKQNLDKANEILKRIKSKSSRQEIEDIIKRIENTANKNKIE
jgi:hypothetical protein